MISFPVVVSPVNATLLTLGDDTNRLPAFKEQFGITPLEYINKERVKLAKQLLADKNNSITSVSLQCGFSDVNYFVRLFKKTEVLHRELIKTVP